MAVAQNWQNRIVGSGEEAPDQLLANPANWRIHPQAQQDALAGVLSEVGWVQHVIVNQRTGHLIDGHLRVSLALRRNEPTVPVLYVDLDPHEEALILATLDPLAAMAATDAAKLDALLRDVRTGEAAVQAMLSELAQDAGLYLGDEPDAADDPGAQVDRADDLRAKWQTERGQLWEIPSQSVPGKAHRLLCGDSTSDEDVARLLQGEAPPLMVTDPPYGVEYDPHWRDEVVGEFGQRRARGGGVANDHIVDWRAAWKRFPGDVAYVWHAGRFTGQVAVSLESAGFDIRAQIIWAKQHFALSRGHYHWQHEPCWYGVRRGRPAHWRGDRSQSTLWEISSLNPAGRREERVAHGTQKPVECMARPIRNHEGDVYDPFLGSGTTMVAAEQAGRLCYGMEIEPKYVAVALERLAGMGLEPRLVSPPE